MDKQNIRNLIEEFDLRAEAQKLPVVMVKKKVYVPIDGIRDILQGMEEEQKSDVTSTELKDLEGERKAAIEYFSSKLLKSISDSRKSYYKTALDALGYWQDHEEKSCQGCQYKDKRHQKCNCCRRNLNLKDCYMEEPDE